LEQFGGTKRRFERIGKREGILFFDDYAHHPKEIEALLSGAKDWLPDNRIVVVFQPHTYSRTKVLLGEFAKSFSKADEVIITDIFASAREETDETVSGEILAKQVANYHPNAVYVSQDDLVKYVLTDLKNGDVFFTLGAGDIYKLHDSLSA
jgi:UDP-N-acetylmuramate--alanine ligase